MQAMKRIGARLLFTLLPALVVGLPLACVAPALGGICGMSMFGLGWQVTAARPEREEIV